MDSGFYELYGISTYPVSKELLIVMIAFAFVSLIGLISLFISIDKE